MFQSPPKLRDFSRYFSPLTPCFLPKAMNLIHYKLLNNMMLSQTYPHILISFIHRVVRTIKRLTNSLAITHRAEWLYAPLTPQDFSWSNKQ